jgi:uncharacterized protein (DUF305 family)
MLLRTLSLVLLTIAAAGCSDSSMRGPMAPGRMMPGAPGGMTGPMGGGMADMFVASEFDYLVRMIPHHEEAIATARLLQAGTARQEMRDFAATIIRTQSAEVAQMQAWLQQWYPGRDTTVAYAPMMRDLEGLTGSALDRAFLEDMIPHHMMAVMMSQQLVTRGLAEHQPVVPFATNIRDTQQAEIRMMRQWLWQWFGR